MIEVIVGGIPFCWPKFIGLQKMVLCCTFTLPPPKRKSKKYHDFSKGATKTLEDLRSNALPASDEPSRNLQNHHGYQQPHSFPVNSPGEVWFSRPRRDKAGTHHWKESWARGKWGYFLGHLQKEISPGLWDHGTSWDQKRSIQSKMIKPQSSSTNSTWSANRF